MSVATTHEAVDPSPRAACGSPPERAGCNQAPGSSGEAPTILARALALQTVLLESAKELERKAPVLEGQRRDYKRALVAHNKLSEKLEETLKEEKRLSQAAREAKEGREAAAKENRMLKQQNADLSRQVQHLLKSQVDRSLNTPMSAGARTAAPCRRRRPRAASAEGAAARARRWPRTTSSPRSS